MELHQIRYFLAVCETGGVTRAAEVCNVAQPSLTRAIKKLEHELGGELFRRSRRGVTLTELGERMRPYLEDSYQALESAKADAESFGETRRATLRLGVMCTLGPSRLIGLFDRLRRKQPSVEVILTEDTGVRLIEKLNDDALDVTLIGMPTLPDQCHAEPLFSERYVIACPPGHRFEDMSVVPMEELDGEGYLLRLNCEFLPHFEALFDKRPYDSLNVVFASEREEWIQSLILAGVGCAIMTENLPMFPEIITRPMIDPEVRREIQLVTPAGRRFTPAVDAFVRIARAYDWRTGR